MEKNICRQVNKSTTPPRQLDPQKPTRRKYRQVPKGHSTSGGQTKIRGATVLCLFTIHLHQLSSVHITPLIKPSTENSFHIFLFLQECSYLINRCGQSLAVKYNENKIFKNYFEKKKKRYNNKYP